MSVNFESATEKEKLRQELRAVREELLKKAQKDAEKRKEQKMKEKLKGDDSWMLPSLEKKLSKSKKSKKSSQHKSKSKREKKSKKSKKTKKKRHSSDKSEDSSSSSEEEIIKKKNKRKGSFTMEESSTSDSSDSEKEEKWVEKDTNHTQNLVISRESWMTESFALPTYSKKTENERKDKDKDKPDTYNPSTSSRELNPYWKNGGTGVPEFRKPREDDDDNDDYRRRYKRSSTSSYNRETRRNNWRKNNKSSEVPETAKRISPERSRKQSPRKSSSETDDSEIEEKKSTSLSNFLTDQQMNELAAKLVKAEILGNENLIKELKDKLENARNVRKNIQENASKNSAPENKTINKDEKDYVLLTTTDSKGTTRPLPARKSNYEDPYGSKSGKNKRRKVETHVSGERVRYFPDDDRYDIKQMFEKEKYTTGQDSDAQFIEMAGKQKNKNDDLEDIFADKIRKGFSEYEQDEKEKNRAIKEHERYERMLEGCTKCFDSSKMEKRTLISVGNSFYLNLPWHEGLQPGHCLLVPIQHIPCSTQLDEDAWNELTDFRRALTRMFSSRSQDVIFFEIARYLNRRPHMEIHCVASKNFEMAPFYFKKAIQESEQMWATNKQLISLKDKDLRRSIPRGLPYFWIHFGMDSGFAHVIEDEANFPANFAQEIIGGILELDPRTWRRPRKEYNIIPKVKQFADWWKPFDCTK